MVNINNIIKGFIKKQKELKILSKMKKMKARYDVLDNKLMSGKINNNELNKYHSLKEEMNKMGKKFILKNGNLVLKKNEVKDVNDDGLEKEETKEETQPVIIPPVESESAAAVSSYNKVESIQGPNMSEEEMNNYSQQQREASIQQRIELEKRKQEQMMLQQNPINEQSMQQQQNIKSQQQFMEENGMTNLNLQQQQQLQQQQHQRQLQQQQQLQRIQQQQVQQQHEERQIGVKIYVKESPEFDLQIPIRRISDFMKEVDNAILAKQIFKFGKVVIDGMEISKYNINGGEILMYSFEQPNIK